MEALKILRGTQANYNNIANKDPNAIYFITDTKRIYIGTEEFSRPTECINDLIFITSDASNPVAIEKQD